MENCNRTHCLNVSWKLTHGGNKIHVKVQSLIAEKPSSAVHAGQWFCDSVEDVDGQTHWHQTLPAGLIHLHGRLHEVCRSLENLDCRTVITPSSDQCCGFVVQGDGMRQVLIVSERHGFSFCGALWRVVVGV